MSFNLGQYRRGQISYLTPLAHELKDLRVDSGDTTEAVFIDKYIQFTQKMQSGKNYYVKVGIARNIESVQNITISLQNSNEADEHMQTLGAYHIPQMPPGVAPQDEEKYVGIIELVISPNGSYDEVVFTLQRNAKDYSTQNPDDHTYGRKISIEIYDVAEIYNVLDSIKQQTLVKIGVQGPPGMLMCINGEDIRVGPNGIYEINNGYKITFIGFIIKQSDEDYFILDYQY